MSGSANPGLDVQTTRPGSCQRITQFVSFRFDRSCREQAIYRKTSKTFSSRRLAWLRVDLQYNTYTCIYIWVLLINHHHCVNAGSFLPFTSFFLSFVTLTSLVLFYCVSMVYIYIYVFGPRSSVLGLRQIHSLGAYLLTYLPTFIRSLKFFIKPWTIFKHVRVYV